MLIVNRLKRGFLQSTASGKLCNPFFAVGWLIIGFLLTYLLINQRSISKTIGNIVAAAPADHHQRQQQRRPVPPPLLTEIGNEKIDDSEVTTQEPSYSFVQLKTSPKNKTITAQLEETLDVLRNQSEDVAGLLEKKIRVLCMILTTEKYHQQRAIWVKRTWGKRCTSLVFISDVDDPSLPAIKVSGQADWGHVWSKVRAGFRWAYDKHLNEFDWFMKADDDTFFIMENLRALLAEFDPNDGVYVGHEFGNPTWLDPKSYYSGGAGYVLSRKALIRFVEDALSMPKYCNPGRNDVPEDVEVGRCLEHVGISTTDTRDHLGRQRFQPLPPSNHLQVGYSPPDFWIWTYDKYPYKEGEECCSGLAISYHYITPEAMQELEYYIYRLHLFGRDVFQRGSLASAKYQEAYEDVAQRLAKRYSLDKTLSTVKPKADLPNEEELNQVDDMVKKVLSTLNSGDSGKTTTEGTTSKTSLSNFDKLFSKVVGQGRS